MSTRKIPILGGDHPIWMIDNHRLKERLTTREIVWSPQRIRLYQPGSMRNPLMQPVTGHEFLNYARRGGHLVVASVIDYCATFPHHFFEEWKEQVDGKFRKVYTCGTLFTGPQGDALKGMFWDHEYQRITVMFTPLNSQFFVNSFVISQHPF